MDARKFASKWVKPDNVRDGSITTRVISVFEGDYGPVLELETGSQFSVNQTNTSTLIKAWGIETNDWIDQELELSLGFYQDRKTNPPVDKETVKVRAISPPKSATGNSGLPSGPLLPPSRIVAPKSDDMDDSIPFVLAFLAVSAVTWLIISGSSALIV